MDCVAIVLVSLSEKNTNRRDTYRIPCCLSGVENIGI